MKHTNKDGTSFNTTRTPRAGGLPSLNKKKYPAAFREKGNFDKGAKQSRDTRAGSYVTTQNER